MEIKKTLYRNGKKAESDSSQQTKKTLQEHKNKTGEMVYVSISPRTTIGLPAHLSQEEKEERIETYKRLHKSIV
ncbi:hypothetical protein LJC11_05565 [Bacteroidales bacterium OttesenSCG-928-I21]|nr:hypothetical protein [Bacteroidales bacterium OttesenSCG-928-I21]